jgi:NADPH:quinone reductase-like Zn-dependent oxidoreductase
MKAVRFSSFGVPHEVGACVELDGPGAPGAGEVLVEMEAFPINPADLLFLEGAYASRPPLPATPGAEGVGRVSAVGAGVTAPLVGDRVILLGRENWAQQRRVKAEQVLPVPADIDVLQLAMLKVNPATALLMLRDYVPLESGDWVIQDAANSGVGTSLIRLAKARGLKTVNVVRRAALAAPLEALGADVVLLDGEDLAARVEAACGDARPKLAIDAVAGETCRRLAECLAEGGTLVNYGMLSGQPCMVAPEQIVFRGITLTGFWLAKVLGGTARAALEEIYGELAGHLADGRLAIAVEATFPIEEIKAALAAAERQGRDGKILVTPNGPV